MSNKKTSKEIVVTHNTFVDRAEDLNQACSTILENHATIFLPYKRLDKTKIQKKFYENNQKLEVDSNLFEKIEIQGRLLGQDHKDILEILLSSKKRFDKINKSFKVVVSTGEILKKLKSKTRNHKWIIDKIAEISQCRIVLVEKKVDGGAIERSVNFGFIEESNEISSAHHTQITVRFTSAYTAFMSKTEMVNYLAYVDDIIQLCNGFTKSLVRYMLTHQGNKDRPSRIRISTFVEKMGYEKVMGKRLLRQALKEFYDEENLKQLQDLFGITVMGEVVEFIVPEDKPRYHIPVEKQSLFE